MYKIISFETVEDFNGFGFDGEIDPEFAGFDQEASNTAQETKPMSQNIFTGMDARQIIDILKDQLEATGFDLTSTNLRTLYFNITTNQEIDLSSEVVERIDAFGDDVQQIATIAKKPGVFEGEHILITSLNGIRETQKDTFKVPVRQDLESIVDKIISSTKFGKAWKVANKNQKLTWLSIVLTDRASLLDKIDDSVRGRLIDVVQRKLSGAGDGFATLGRGGGRFSFTGTNA